MDRKEILTSNPDFDSAGIILRTIGYKRTIVLGLLLYVLGALCFYPAAMNEAYGGFVGSLFTIASGLSMLENCKLKHRMQSSI